MDLINRLASLTMGDPLPDSITEWGLLAVSASPHTGEMTANWESNWLGTQFLEIDAVWL